MTWARVSAVNLGIRNGNALELHIAEKTGREKNESSGLFNGYLGGQRKCFTKWVPRPASHWVDIVERAWPGSGDWFYTPVWYLLEDIEYSHSQVLQCTALLPQRWRYVLASDGQEGTSAGLSLNELWPDLIYELAEPVSPWALGAMACAFRRAELAGQSTVYLRAGLGMLWELDQLTPALDPWVQEPLLKLRDLIVHRIESTVFPVDGPMRVSISDKSSAQFSKGVTEHLRTAQRMSSGTYYWG